MSEKIVFGNENQPFFELSPICYEPFNFLNYRWKSLMQFFIITSISDLRVQDELKDISDISRLISVAKKRGFGKIECTDKRIFLEGIYEAFKQNNHRALILISTGSAELIYNAPKSFLTENNRYGKILMRLREELEMEDKGEVK